MRLRVGHEHSQFWLIMARFMDYYSLFWGPGVISTIDEPRGAFTCRSSTFVVFVDSDAFRGLLLTVLASPRCAYVSVINNDNFGRFWPVSWTITLFWCPTVISTIDERRDVFMCRSSTLVVLPILARFMDYYSLILGP